MGIKKLARWGRGRFGVASTKFVIRPRFFGGAWLVCGCLLLICVGLVLGNLFSVIEVGDEEVGLLRRQMLLQRDELLLLQARLGGGQSSVEMERSVKVGLLAKVRSLEQENAELKEDMLLFERLVSPPGEEASVKIESFRVMQDASGSYRYRWLVAYQPGRQQPEFHGRVQIVLSFSEGVGGGVEDRLDVKSFSRREGGLVVPRGVRVTAAELRVLQNGVIKAKRMAQF